MPLLSLETIAAATGAGKAGYCDQYPRYFEPLRQMPLKLLELGVDRGGSLEMWAQYFPRARIVGLDLGERAPASYSTDRIRHVIAHQEDATALALVSDKEAPEGWDIIIDDCAHLAAPALAAFQALFPRLRIGGFYAIEDWGTGYWPDWEDGAVFDAGIHFKITAQSHHAGLVGLIKQMVDEVGIDDVRQRNRAMRPSLFEYLHISNGMAIAKKATHASDIGLG